MNRVAQSEAELLTVARTLVGQADAQAAEPLLRVGRPVAPTLGPTAAGLLKKTLAAGGVLQLARRGGWQRRRHLRGGEVVAGRLWERHPKLQLHFTQASMKLCRWMLASSLSLPEVPELAIDGELSLADELLHYLACDLLARSGCSGAIEPAGAFGRSCLCWLGFPSDLRGHPPASELPSAERIAAWLAGGGAVLLEALQGDLTARWIETERAKHRILDGAAMSDLGDRQTRLLDALLAALERAGREDLAGFLLQAGARLLPEGVSARSWCSGLDPRSPLSERSRARRLAGAFLRSLVRIHGWVERWRLTPFFEEGYAAAQALLAQWETLGDAAYRRALGVLQELESIEAPAPAGEGRGP